LLLQSGADPRLKDGNGRTILDIAITTNRVSGVKANFAKTRKLIEEALKSTEPKAQ
jgi:hypothetical protein